MKSFHNSAIKVILFLFFLVWAFASSASAQAQVSAGSAIQGRSSHESESKPPEAEELITPEQLAGVLGSAKSVKPLILNVGPRVLFLQAHIPGAEYIGPGSNSQAIQRLRERVRSLPHDRFIVLYCGCCPWVHCPNVLPAYNQLRAMGFTKVKMLYIAGNLGTDWVYRGYPTAKGE